MARLTIKDLGDEFQIIKANLQSARTRLDHQFSHIESVGAVVNAERTHRLKLADDQRAYVDSEIAGLRRLRELDLNDFIHEVEYRQQVGRAIYGLRDRDFFGRLRWLLTGK